MSNESIPAQGNEESPLPEKAAEELAPTPRVERAIQKLADQKPEAIVEMMTLGSGMFNPLHSKMEASHITKILDHSIEHDKQEFTLATTKEQNSTADRVSTRRYVFAAFACIVLLLLTILILFKDKPEVLVPLVSGISGLAAGFVAGFGIGKNQPK